jgi:cytochrome c oxidase subunit 2
VFSRVVFAALLLGLLALLLSGCEADTPQNTFAAEGEVARDQRDLFYYAMWPAIGIMVLVELGLVVILLRFRRRRPDDVPAQIHGNTRLELAWTIAPAALLLVLAVPMMSLLFKLGEDPGDDAFTVNVTGIQWAWQFEYPEIVGENGNPISTVKDVYFPAGQKIRFNVTSSDVIHSFWIPRLGGKLDAIPGRNNRLWLKADNPGSFAGQCAEFCGKDHAIMKLVAHALSEDDFNAWVLEQGGTRISNSGGEVTSTPAAGR